jgi:HSP20 family molecular chaperone IbpA
MITTRRFWCCNAPSKAIHVDVRTPEGVSESEAQMIAEEFARREFKSEYVFATRMPPKRHKAQFTVRVRQEN